MNDITPVPANPQIAVLIREAREALDLPREGLAFKAGVSVKTIERIERGETVPHRATARAIAQVLGLDPTELRTAA